MNNVFLRFLSGPFGAFEIYRISFPTVKSENTNKHVSFFREQKTRNLNSNEKTLLTENITLKFQTSSRKFKLAEISLLRETLSVLRTKYGHKLTAYLSVPLIQYSPFGPL